MSDQPTLWEPPLGPIDPHVLSEDVRRLAGQCQTILEMLRRRPHTNDELAAVSRKYTSRISDLRKAGHAVGCKVLGGGLTLYTLEKSNA